MQLASAILVYLVLRESLAIPPSYVFHVEHTCSTTVDGRSQVDILTDLSVVVSVECDGRTQVVPTSDKVHYSFTASYEGDPNTECVFKRRENSGIYLLVLVVGWSEPLLNSWSREEKYLVTCTLAPHAVNQTKARGIQNGLLGPLELQERMGSESLSSYILQITDIAGNILNTHIPIGRKIRLKATMTPAESEIGFRAVSCNAVAGTFKYAVLKGGCGDGIIFNRNAGFTTKGLQVLSPFFEAFRLRQAESIAFDCNFTACKNNCDGSSCLHERRRKREASSHGLDEVATSSSNVTITEPRSKGYDFDAKKLGELHRLGVAVIPESCRMTTQGVECQATYTSITTSSKLDSFDLMTVLLLAVQAVMTLGMIISLVIFSGYPLNT